MSPIVSWLRRSVGRDINKRFGFMLLSIGDSDAALCIAMARRGDVFFMSNRNTLYVIIGFKGFFRLWGGVGLWGGVRRFLDATS